MHPKNVVSPRERTRNHRIIFMSPKEWTGGQFSICEAEVFDLETSRWQVQTGLRWDGVRTDENDKGFPIVSGQPVWFWLPHKLANVVRGSLNDLEILKSFAVMARPPREPAVIEIRKPSRAVA